MNCAACEKYRDVPSSKCWSDLGARRGGCRVAPGSPFLWLLSFGETKESNPRVQGRSHPQVQFIHRLTARSAGQTGRRAPMALDHVQTWIPASRRNDN